MRTNSPCPQPSPARVSSFRFSPKVTTLSAFQAPTHRRLCCLPVAAADGLPLGRDVSAGGHPQLGGDRQVRHHLPVLLGGVRCRRGHAEARGPVETSAPKVRASAVTLAGRVGVQVPETSTPSNFSPLLRLRSSHHSFFLLPLLPYVLFGSYQGLLSPSAHTRAGSASLPRGGMGSGFGQRGWGLSLKAKKYVAEISGRQLMKQCINNK